LEAVAKSNEALDRLGPDIQWWKATLLTTRCIYLAEDKAEHAEKLMAIAVAAPPKRGAAVGRAQSGWNFMKPSQALRPDGIITGDRILTCGSVCHSAL
jgi:hypothetical protein